MYTSIVLSPQLFSFKYCCLTLIILFNINHLFAHSEVMTRIDIQHYLHTIKQLHVLLCKTIIVSINSSREWFAQLYTIKYSYLIQILSKQIYLTHRWRHNRYDHSAWVKLGVIVKKGWHHSLRNCNLTTV